MSHIPVTKEQMVDYEPVMLPTTENVSVNGIAQQVDIKYIAEFVSVKPGVSGPNAKTPGEGLLTAKLSVDFNNEKVYIDDIYSLSKKALWRLGEIVAMLNLDADHLDTDDFLGKYVLITVKNDEFRTKRNDKDIIIKSNKVKSYVRVLTSDEIVAAGGQPF